MAGDLILDTSVIVAHLRADVEISARLELASNLWISTIALGELFYGAYRSTDPALALSSLERFLNIVDVLPVDEATSDRYGLIKKALAEKGTPIPDNDIWIAAAAIQHDILLAARDDHFSRVVGLKVEKW